MHYDFAEWIKKGHILDLHIHTVYSDGRLNPSEVVKRAKEHRIVAVAIADHDTIDGVDEALKEGRKQGVNVIPAIEITVDDKYLPDAEVHLLGINIDPESPAIRNISKIAKRRRELRGRRMIERLRSLGYEITFKDVQRLRKMQQNMMKVNDEGVIARPHIAQALLSHKNNLLRMKKEFKLKHEPSMDDVFDYLIGDGCPAYVKKINMTVKEAISCIRKAGGLPVIAHPGLLENHSKRRKLSTSIIKRYKKLGIMGIEVYHPQHTKPQIKFYSSLAKSLGLIITGGSDFHGIEKDEEIGRISPYI